eukprot:COSAG02_NODE_41583_length_393_cov_0.690476_1_plen_33_part_10
MGITLRERMADGWHVITHQHRGTSFALFTDSLS